MNILTHIPRKIEQVKFPLQEVSRQLAKIGSSGSFATRLTVAAGDLHLEVQGVGRIRFPITPSTARRLCAVARPARHGFKDETRLDQRVRDTWVIAKSSISIDQSRWMNTLAPQPERICRGLGLPQGCRLKAQLHNMLVYAPGQFFAPHQDSEKTDDMIGTLVVSLPSRFTGGTVSIEHHGAKMRVGGSDKNLTFIAFYADCHHEVHPIREGYRIVLAYNLVLEHNATAARAPTAAISGLTDTIREFFATPGQPRWSGDHGMRSPPDRLVYLLDHEYTQRGLRWNRLKNSDAHRAIALQEVARKLDCEIFLALADVHETWSCEDEYSGYSDYGQRYYGDDDDDPDENEGGESLGETPDPKLTELIDSDVELRHWLGAGGRWEAVAARVDAAELCYTRPSVDLEPFESEHEGYTGNAGNTVEHWYHRAAVVLWPRERTFVIRAKASPRWGIGEVAKSLRARNPASAIAMAQRLVPFFFKCHGTDRKACLVRCHAQSRRKAGRSERRRRTAAAVRAHGADAEGCVTTHRPTRRLWTRLVPHPAADMGLGRESRTAANTTLVDGLYTAGTVPNIVRKRLVGGTATCWLDPLRTVGMVARAVKADSTARLGKGRDARDGQPR
jgi:2-oxoglutarate-Fe(II)-dependent oxygenase superfamily protein